MAKDRMDDSGLDQVVSRLDDLKRLMILQLLASGVKGTQIAKALGVDKSVVSRMVPAREVQKLADRLAGSK